MYIFVYCEFCSLINMLNWNMLNSHVYYIMPFLLRIYICTTAGATLHTVIKIL